MMGSQIVPSGRAFLGCGVVLLALGLMAGAFFGWMMFG